MIIFLIINLKLIKSLTNFIAWKQSSGNKELHLKKPGFTYSTCGAFTKHHKKIQKFRETGNLKHLDRNE